MNRFEIWIEAGEFKPGEQFPTENQLCQEYGVSRGTVGRAINILVDKGWLRRVQGRGTFVNRPSLSPAFFRLTNFSEDMRQRGLEPSTKLLSREVFPADEEITARLAHVKELGVIARTSTKQYKNTDKSVTKIGEELGVDYILEGTVRWQKGATAAER